MKIHILLNISRNKGTQTLTLGQLIEHNKKIFFSKNHSENEARRLVPNLILFFEKALNEGKASGLQLSFNIF